MGPGFGQVHKGGDIADIAVYVVTVGYPDFNPSDNNTGSNNGRGCHRLVVLLSKKIGEKKVAIHIVLIHRYREAGVLCSALYLDLLVLAALLRYHRVDAQITELHFGFDPKKALAALYQTASKG